VSVRIPSSALSSCFLPSVLHIIPFNIIQIRTPIMKRVLWTLSPWLGTRARVGITTLIGNRQLTIKNSSTGFKRRWLFLRSSRREWILKTPDSRAKMRRFRGSLRLKNLRMRSTPWETVVTLLSMLRLLSLSKRPPWLFRGELKSLKWAELTKS
jgi:hypothetical protein